MLIKRFEAPTMAEALSQVREALGADAIVLGTRTLRREGGRLGWLSRPLVEVTAGIDREAKRESAPEADGRVAPDRSWRDLQISRALLEPLEDELRALRATVEKLGTVAPPLTLAEEVATLRALARQLGRSVEAPEGPVARYRAAGLLPRHATGLARDAERRARKGAGGEAALLDSLASRLASRIAGADDAAPARVQLLVGPPGSGKTTTLAKLAARSAGRKLRLVTMDVERDGEAQRIKRLADELGVRFGLAANAGAIANLVRAGKKDELLLVDTPASGRRAGELLGELAAVRESQADAHVQLVLSATTKEADLRAQVARHAALAPDSLVFTNWDESTEVANVVNLLLEKDVPPLAALGNGPRVPDDYELPDPARIARTLLGAAR
jgi:flagellar biosynthesis protein FlhF